MLTDTIISALTNIFALFCSEGHVESQLAVSRLDVYLGRHYGIKDREEYINLYTDLYDFYTEMPSVDVDRIVSDVCSGLQKEIQHSDCLMVYLRLLEFCSTTPAEFNPNNNIFLLAAKNLGINDDERTLLADFILGKEGPRVHITQFDNFASPLKTLYLPKSDIMVFSYSGEDAKHVNYNGIQISAGMYQVWDNSGVLKNSLNGSSLYYSQLRTIHEAGQQTTHIDFCGRDIDFHFPNSTNGIHNMSFNLHSGELVAIMGGSGAGKTTLVSLLNGTLIPQKGSITINGKDISAPEARDQIGFVPQDDLLIEELTVYQNLYYTAKMCLDSLTEEQREERINKVLRELGLEQTRNLTVGSPIKKVISGGQRKRLNIALELLREPTVLFLDEPTSGLSSVDTENVINLLKEQTLNGRLVITNIHQPSSDVYKLFDRLWMLDAGGYIVFDGNPIDAITYFKQEANYADASTSMCPTCGNVNPEVVLNIIEEKIIDGTGKQTKQRKVSPQQWHERYLACRQAPGEVTLSQLPPSATSRPSALKQWWVYLRRGIATKVTNVQYLLLTLLATPLLALVCALLTRYSEPGEEYTLLANKNFVVYIFMAVIVSTFVGMIGPADEIIRGRALLKRERFLRLSYRSYIWATVAQQAVITALQTLLFVLVGNTIIGVGFDMLFTWWGVLYVTALLASVTGLFLSQLLSTAVAVYISIPILLVPQILLCGLVVNFSDICSQSTTGNVPAIGNAIPSRWAFEALAVSNYTDNAYERDIFPYDKEKCEKMYLQQVFVGKLQETLETMEDERKRSVANRDTSGMTLLRNELPYISEQCKMPAYSGKYDYASLHKYLDEAEHNMSVPYNKAALKADRILSNRTDDQREMKRNNCNEQLENNLAGLNANTRCAVVNGHLVPTAGWVYLTPRTTCGNAPFYSSEKRIGTLTMPTLPFNLLVMAIMIIIGIATLVLNVPNKIRFLLKYFEHYKKIA